MTLSTTMPKTVLILGNPQDEHASHVAEQLSARGVRVAWLDGSEFPASLRIAFEPGSTGYFVDTASGEKIGFDEIESVYWRCYNGIPYSDLPHAEQAEIAMNDSRSLFESLLIDLPCRWVNGWKGYQIHQTKPAALARVKRLDLGPHVRVPETLLTNDPDAVRAFADRVGPCIFKPVQGGAHTLPLTDAQLTDEHLEVLQHAPVTIQQAIEGTDVRVFIAGERVLSCELRSDALDFRDDNDPEIVAIELPADISDTCLAICKALHLVWTGMDFRRTADGTYYYFESNASPMFLGFEQRSGLPITAALVDLLVG
jgi:D-alanine-D-alanine ligase-like ATP-grasp enzyme